MTQQANANEPKQASKLTLNLNINAIDFEIIEIHLKTILQDGGAHKEIDSLLDRVKALPQVVHIESLTRVSEAVKQNKPDIEQVIMNMYLTGFFSAISLLQSYFKNPKAVKTALMKTALMTK